MKVSLKDIYYFETIKSSHYCKVVHKEGTGKIHADVTPLYEKVAPYFFQTKSSTLANLDLVRKVDTRNRILYFEENIFCTYAQRLGRELKEKLEVIRKSEAGTTVKELLWYIDSLDASIMISTMISSTM